MKETSQKRALRVAPEPELWLRLEGVSCAQWGYPITSEAQTIGRSPGCHIRVGDRTVSREHAVVWLKEGVPYIRDLDSINGTRVNGKRIQTCVLMPGDMIALGQITLRVTSTAESAEVNAGSASPALLVKASASATEQYTPTNLEETKLREDLAAIYALGGTLALCSCRSEALHQLFDWMGDWLGVTQAAVVFHIDEQLKVTARNWGPEPTRPERIHWPIIRMSLERGASAEREVLRSRQTKSADSKDEPREVLAAWIPHATPPGVIYAEWKHDSDAWEKRCSELVSAAAKVLGNTLVRLGGEPSSDHRPDRNSEATWIENLEADLLVGGSVMQPVREFIRRAAAVDAIVLINGETGTGKELVARSIHQQSGRAKGPFVARNCSAFAESLLEDELFGHEPGAFTGAMKLHKGVFDQANHGTLLLDEIGETTPALQAKLLRVLEEQSFHRVGGQQPVLVDVRIIAATNRDLVQAVQAGQFRRDLFYRLEVLTIHLPPLRDRAADIPALAEHFTDVASKRWNLPRLPLSSKAVHKLQSHHWPGNARELRNSIDRAVLLSQGSTRIEADHILVAQGPSSDSGCTRLEDLEFQHITQVLERAGGNKAKAAALLGIERSTLLRKLRRFSPRGPGSKRNDQ